MTGSAGKPTVGSATLAALTAATTSPTGVANIGGNVAARSRASTASAAITAAAADPGGAAST
ncbi:hypothetical protein, partial [Mycobacterium marinum]|uniref:hypothetical protein n=1 Tax=Mycobacterium marinum TaxID=1781 RepID=UPI0035632122